MENSGYEPPGSPRCYKVSESNASAAAQTDIEPSGDIPSTATILNVAVGIILRRRKEVWGGAAKLLQEVPAFQHAEQEDHCLAHSDDSIEEPPLSDQAATMSTVQRIRRDPTDECRLILASPDIPVSTPNPAREAASDPFPGAVSVGESFYISRLVRVVCAGPLARIGDGHSAPMYPITESLTEEIPFSIEQNTWLLCHGSEGRGINGLRAWKRIELDFIARFQKRFPAPLLRIKFNKLKYEQRRRHLFEKQQCREKERDDAVQLIQWQVAQAWLMENIHKFQTDSREVDWQMLADLLNDTVEWSVTGAWLRVLWSGFVGNNRGYPVYVG